MTGKRREAPYEPKPSRVDWRPVAAMVDLGERSPQHSGRPPVEALPQLMVPPLRKLGAAEGVVLTIKAVDHGLSVALAIKADYRPDGGTLRLAWEYKPNVGKPEQLTQRIELAAVAQPFNSTMWKALCPSCGATKNMLVFAGRCWCCRTCLGVEYDVRNLRATYTREKAVRRTREKLGLSPTLMSPIVIGRGVSRRRIKAAYDLFRDEHQLVEDMLNTKRRL